MGFLLLLLSFEATACLKDKYTHCYMCRGVYNLNENTPDKVLRQLYFNTEKLKHDGDSLGPETERRLRIIVCLNCRCRTDHQQKAVTVSQTPAVRRRFRSRIRRPGSSAEEELSCCWN